MTDHSWNWGLQDLLAAFPDRDLSPAVLVRRGQVYRRELDHLTDEQWAYATRAALRSETWFPTIKALLGHAADAPRRVPEHLMLPEDTRTEEERQRDWDAGMALFRAALDAEMRGPKDAGKAKASPHPPKKRQP